MTEADKKRAAQLAMIKKCAPFINGERALRRLNKYLADGVVLENGATAYLLNLPAKPVWVAPEVKE